MFGLGLRSGVESRVSSQGYCRGQVFGRNWGLISSRILRVGLRSGLRLESGEYQTIFSSSILSLIPRM